jgi:hypothetical protein
MAQLHKWNGLQTRSTSVTLLSSLHVKWLTQRCYDWNDAYKVALTLINIQDCTKPTNHKYICALGPHGPTSQLIQATNGVGYYIHPPLKGWRPRQLTTYMWQMSRTTPWYTPPRAHATMVDAPNTICNTLRPKTTYMAQLLTRSTSLRLSSSLRVKGLIQRCYDWNDKAYKVALTLLNFKGDTKPTNHNYTCATWVTWINFTTTTGY